MESRNHPIVVQDRRLKMTVERRNDAVFLSLTDLKTGKDWGPSLLMALEVHDRTIQRVDRLEQYRVDAVEAVENGVHVTVGDHYRRVSAAIWVRLVDGELEVLVPPSESYDRAPARCRVAAVDILPDLMTVGSSGVLVLPIGAGALCRPGNKARLSDRFLIYVEQSRWEICSLLPVVAAHDQDGGLALLALEGDCDTECRVETDGQGNGKTGFAACIRKRWPDPVDYANRRYIYSPMDAGDDPAHFTAKRLRRHVTGVLGKPTLKERARESPEVAYMLDAISFKAWHGMENEGPDMVNKDKSSPISYMPGMTFAECRGHLQRLLDAGIDKAHVFINGYQPRGHDGLYPTRFPIDERPGGERGFRELVEFGKRIGYHMTVHDDFMMNVPHSPDYDPDLIIHDFYGETLLGGWWSGGVEYQTWGLALPPEKLEKHLEKMHQLGLSGLYYCDYMFRPLEINYHPKWRGTRSACAEGQVRIIDAVRNVFGAAGIEFGSFPGALAADWVIAASGRPLVKKEWPLTHLVDERVPMWQLTFHGLVIHGHAYPDWRSLMNAVLMGEHVGCPFSTRNVKADYALTDQRVTALAACYDIAVKRFGYLKQEELVSFSRLSDKVSKSVFSDGSSVVVDREEERLEVNNVDVPRPVALL